MNAVVEPLPLRALARLGRALEFAPPPLRLVGMHSSAILSLLLSQPGDGRFGKRPQLVVVSDLETAEQLAKDLLFFDPARSAPILAEFDVGPYSTLYPNPRLIHRRLQWLHQAMQAKPGQVFIATAPGLMQKTLPFDQFAALQSTVRRGDTVDRNFFQKLESAGYLSVPTVEDRGTFSNRGGIVDVFSPAHERPVRFELFGDLIESIREFDPATQMSTGEIPALELIPAREVLFSDDRRERAAAALSASAASREVDKDELQEILREIAHGSYFPGIEFLLGQFFKSPALPAEYFSEAVDLWIYDHVEILRSTDQFYAGLEGDYKNSESHPVLPKPEDLYSRFEQIPWAEGSSFIQVDKIDVRDAEASAQNSIEVKSFSFSEFSATSQALNKDADQQIEYLSTKIREWRGEGHAVFACSHSKSSAERLALVIEKAGFRPIIVADNHYEWSQYLDSQSREEGLVHVIPRRLGDGFRLPEENLVFLRDEDIWGKRHVVRANSRESSVDDRAGALTFGELKPGDYVVHRIHGIGVYDGLKVIEIDGAAAEFIELKYKDNDRLFLPVYRVGQLQKYTGPSAPNLIDKLGGTSWQKTQTKVRHHLRDVAAKLLQLYAKRAQAERPALPPPDHEYTQFEAAFPYQETEDQLRAINDVLADLQKPNPMDRLICGDVGFGKTEVALRAAFKVAHDRRQVAIIAPTTILTLQHYETFKKRFKDWPIEIRVLNRFISSKDVKASVAGVRDGTVDIVIGTHRLLSKDIQFKNLGLLIIDEEQKFGVVHKERLRHMREAVDTIAMSATPIPRTLNMSLMGIRDLSLITTAPENRLPTRTFVCKFDAETIRKGVLSEISRGGQVFFLHNRVQSIDECAHRLREILPDVRMAIAHGQMPEEELEKTMIRFFHHEIDMLICTAIIESGMDIPRANTIFIDNAYQFGVSQLYQLRGRVGRSQDRAYCYLLIPADRKLDKDAQERLKIIQENTALGSGLRVAHYDLELRGAGDILGEDQSGHIHAVGYELYLELLDEAIADQRGEARRELTVEPEINLRIPALIPDKYIADLRLRLYYYKALSQIQGPDDLDRIESELKDQFGPLPEPVLNLLGLMLIRKTCRDLGVRDISAGKATLSLAFTESTPLPPAEVIRLTSRENKKYQITPDQRLKIRMNEITWPRVIDELEALLKLCPSKLH